MGEGLVEVTGQRVSIVTDTAIAADKINQALVEEGASVPLHVFAKSCLPKKPLPCTPHWPAHSLSCVLSNAIASSEHPGFEPNNVEDARPNRWNEYQPRLRAHLVLLLETTI